jgi:hypothetical protein
VEELHADPEIRDNDLAEKTIEIIDRLRPHLNTLLLAAAGLLRRPRGRRAGMPISPASPAARCSRSTR